MDDELALLHFIESGAVSDGGFASRQARRSSTGGRPGAESRADGDTPGFGFGYEEEERQRRLYPEATRAAATDADLEDDDDEELEDEEIDDEAGADFDEDDELESDDLELDDDADEELDDAPRSKKKSKKTKAELEAEERVARVERELAEAKTAVIELTKGQSKKEQSDAYEAGQAELRQLNQRWEGMDPLEAAQEKLAYVGNIARELAAYKQQVEERERTQTDLVRAKDQHEQVVQFLAQGGRSDDKGQLNHEAAAALLPEDIEELRDYVEWDAWTMQAWCDRRLKLRAEQKRKQRKAAGARRRQDTAGAERGTGSRGAGSGRSAPRQPSRTLEELLDRL